MPVRSKIYELRFNWKSLNAVVGLRAARCYLAANYNIKVDLLPK